MGLVDGIKSLVGSGEQTSDTDDIAEDFQKELEQEEALADDGFNDTQGSDEGLGPWDNAYRFAEDMLESDGHASMMEFTTKVMFHEIQTSNLYRDRIEEGVKTIEQVTGAKESIERLKGDRGDKDYGDQAKKLSEVNDLMDEIDRLEGREDQIVDEALRVGRDLAEGLAKNATEGGAGVESSVSRLDEDLE